MNLQVNFLKKQDEKILITILCDLLKVSKADIKNYMQLTDRKEPKLIEYNYDYDEKEQFKTFLDLWIDDSLVINKHPVRLAIDMNRKVRDYVLLSFYDLRELDTFLLLSPENDTYEVIVESPEEGNGGTNWVDFEKMDLLKGLQIP
jgi:hypothetical protein